MESCCDTSVRLNESIAGTALANTVHWLLIEVPGVWAAKTLDAPSLSEPVRDHITHALAALPGSRFQLIRRPQATEGVRIFAATVGGQIHLRTVPDAEAISNVDLGAMFQGEGDLVEGSMTLVCTHGVRDVCCAKEGVPVFHALENAAVGSIWQTTHLGGHRFAATLVVLPAGVQFGRVTATEVPDMVAALAKDEIYRIDRYRGRTSLPREAQVAEAHLRQAKDLMGVDDVQWLGTDGNAHRFVVAQRTILVQTNVLPGPQARKVSCGSDVLKTPTLYGVSSSG